MPIGYEVAPDEVTNRISRLIELYHGELLEHEVSISALMAENATGEPCLKLHGYGAAAIVKITPLKQRVMGIADATITIDRIVWNGLNSNQRDALIDHEIEHLELVKKEVSDELSGETREIVATDDHGRPKLKIRLHDWNLQGFQSIAERHKANALEIVALKEAAHDVLWPYRQLFMNWSDDMAGDSQRKANGKNKAAAKQLAAGLTSETPSDAVA